jgi:hypothetical protein
MKILKDITEDEMASVFLRAKIGSFRFAEEMQQIMKDCNADIEIIDDPNFDDKNENKLRQKLLQSFGGADDGHLFKNFPKDVAWKKALLSKSDMQRVKYINYDYWNELSGGSRLVLDGAANVSYQQEYSL